MHKRDHRRVQNFKISLKAYNQNSILVLELLFELLQADSGATQRSRVISGLSAQSRRRHQSPNIFGLNFREMEATLAQDVGKKRQKIIATEMPSVVGLAVRVGCVFEYHRHGGQQKIQFLEWQFGFLELGKQHRYAIQRLRRWWSDAALLKGKLKR